MKKLTAIFLALALLLPVFTFAEEKSAIADDITANCTFSNPGNKSYFPKLMCDRQYTTSSKVKKQKNPWLAVEAPKGEKIYSAYICFANMPASYEVQHKVDGEWTFLTEGDTRFHHVTYEFPEGETSIRIYSTEEKQLEMSINEIFLFGQGEFPDFVQQWQPTVEKADILFLSTHPDDELIFFGGGIPTYCSRGKSVAVAYLTYSNTTRRSELLNGLWHMGLRNYPIIGEFRDYYVKKDQNPYNISANVTKGGKPVIQSWLTEILRKYKPDVVVTQDIKGEYGHRQHIMVSETAGDCVEMAPNPENFPESAEKYGTWQVKKFYRHLWSENQIHMDWSVPLSAADGKTGLQLADEAFTLFHITQHSSGFNVKDTGKKYDNTLFGLVSSTVGEDTEKNDFLENIK